MKHFCSFLLAAAVPFAVAHAQSYITKDVKFEGSPYAKADLMKVAGLKSNGSFTKAELDAAVQALADTGLFAATNYKIDASALTLTLTPVDPKQLLPVDYANFVWWKPEEITPLVQAKVPLYDGRLPANGNLLEVVEAAVVALLKEKGVDAKVDQSVSSAGGVVLAVTRPEVKIGSIQFDGASPATEAEQEKVRARLAGEDYEEKNTRKELEELATQMFRDDGYLDIAVEAGAHGEPHAAGLARYEVGLVAKVQGDALYHVSGVTLEAAPPVSKAELQKEINLKAGEVAGVYALRSNLLRMETPYHGRGYREADAKVVETKDTAKHEVAYALHVEPGPLYHVAAVRTVGLSAEQQAEVERDVKVGPGTVADNEFSKKLFELQMKKVFSGTKLAVGMEQNKKDHTMTYVVRLAPGRVK